jgi:PKD repeat protein
MAMAKLMFLERKRSRRLQELLQKAPLIVAFWLMGCGISAFGADAVTTTADGGAGSLRQAIADAEAANVPDMIAVPEGHYVLSLGALSIDGFVPLTIQGAGAGQTIIDANALSSVLEVGKYGNVTLKDLTITGGRALAGNYAWDAGCGGGINNSGNLSLSNVAVSSNNAAGTLEIFGVAPFYGLGACGGGIWCNGGSLTLTACVIKNNSATGCAGDNCKGLVYPIGCEPIPGGVGGDAYGGGIYVANAAALIVDTVFDGNKAIGGAGGGGEDVFSAGQNGANGGQGGSACGGAIACVADGYLEILNSTINGCSAVGAAGGAGGSGGSGLGGNGGNSGAAEGGGIYVSGNAILLTDSTVSNNAATGGAGGAGGQGTADGIGGNGGEGNGGGIYVLSDRNSTIALSTIAGNEVIGGAGGAAGVSGSVRGADGNGYGGGICSGALTQGMNFQPGILCIYNSTIANNTATANGEYGYGFGGGFSCGSPNSSAGIFATSSLFTGNTTGYQFPDIAGNIIGDCCLCEQTDDPFWGGNNIVGQGAILGDLADNGGPTKTMAILWGPGFAAGSNPNGYLYDQRGPGFVRQFASAPDIGAYEAQPATPSVTNSVTNENTQTTYGLVITPARDDSFFRITGITNGILYQNDGVLVINDGDYIFAHMGVAGLKFTPAPGSCATGHFTIQASVTEYDDSDLGGEPVQATITVTPGSVAITSVGASSGAEPNQPVSFVVDAISPAGDALSYLWDFGDGATSTAASPSHAFAHVGTYNVVVTVTDASGASASSTLSVDVVAATLPDGSLDSNGYGISDVVCAAAGGNPFGAGVAAPAPQALTINKVGIKLDFSKPTGNDSIQLSGELPISAGFKAANQQVILDIGGVAILFNLNNRGSSKNSSGMFKLALKSTNGHIQNQTAQFNAILDKGSFQAALANQGLTDANFKNAAKDLWIGVYFNQQVFAKTQMVHYTAKINQSGSAK